MSRRTKWISVLVGALCVALFTLVHQVVEPPNIRIDGAVPTVETPEAKQPPAVVPSSEVRASGGSGAKTSNDFEERPASMPIRPTVIARPLELWNERDAPAPMLEATDSAFANEPVDAGWSPGMEGQILSEVAQMTDDDLVNVQVECRTSLCRIQLTQSLSLQPDEVAPTAMQVLTKLFARLAYGRPTLPIAMVRDGPAALTTVAYLRRDAAR